MSHFLRRKCSRLLLVLALFGSGCQEARGWALLSFDPGVEGLQAGWMNLRLTGCQRDLGIADSADPVHGVDPRTTALQPELTAVPGSIVYTLEGTRRTSHEQRLDSQVGYRLIVAVRDQHASGFFSVDPNAIPQQHYRARGHLGSGRVKLELAAIAPTVSSSATVRGVELLVGNCTE